jgi:hypothetical protein
MTRAELADHLRQTVRASRHLSLESLAKLNELDDDLIVDNFLNMTCGDCGKKLSEGLNVEQIIVKSHNLAAFSKAHANDHTFTFIQYEWPSEIDVEGTEGGAAK